MDLIERYRRLLWWTMDLWGVRDSVEQKFLVAIGIQIGLSVLVIALLVWFIGVDVVAESLTRTRLFILAAVVFIAGVGIINTLWVVRRDILDPIVEMREVAEDIAAGELADPEPRQQPDETGDLKEAFIEMHDFLELVTAQAQAMKNEEFDAPVLEEAVPGELGEALAAMQEGIQMGIRDRDRKLAANERALHRFHQVASRVDMDFDEKLHELLSIGRVRLGADYGYVTNIDPTDGTQEIVAAIGNHDQLVPGETTKLKEAYCRHTVESTDGLVSFESKEEFEDDPAHDIFGFSCYIGGKIERGDELYGTICFGGDTAKEFSQVEQRFVQLLSLWASHERERIERMSDLRSFKRAVEYSGNAIYILDTDGHITYVNHAFEEMFGYEASEVIGKTPALLHGGSDVKVSYAALWQTTDAGGVQQTETEHICKDGERKIIGQTTAPIVDQDGNIESYVVVNNDITERKERANELRERQEQLDILRQVLARVLRHNIRNDLTVIKGNAQRIATGVEDSVNTIAETIVDTADKIERVSENARLIAELVERGGETETYHIDQVVQETVRTVDERFPEVTVDVEVNGSYQVAASEGLTMAIENLIENAAEHNTPPDQWVEVNVTRDDTVDIVIEDNGPGIPAQEIEVLDNGEETELQHGSGAGLWLVNWVVEASDGDIVFEQTDDGTRVTISLPSMTSQLEDADTAQ